MRFVYYIGDIAETFCNKLSAKGYTVGIYANKDWFTNYLTDSCFNNWTKWVAQYNTVCNYQGKYDMWQCSSTGRVPGISGNVDLIVHLKIHMVVVIQIMVELLLSTLMD